MDLIVDKNKTVCFTGHRPEKLPDKGDPRSQVVLVLKSLLRQQILDAVDDGFDTFITGMAAGVDMWAAEIVEELMEKNSSLKLYGAYPFRNYDARYKTPEDIRLTQDIVSRATGIVYVNEYYSNSCMFERNRFMADRSSRMIAVIGDYRTGTGYTVRYAQKVGLDVRILDLNRLFPQMRPPDRS
ncbi:MAG: SLOG family protein [Oscillospiraceae bacterium]